MSWMENDESEYLMLSGIQHFRFCPRQWALIHIEQQWVENVKTIEGQHVHERADQPFLKEKRGNKIIVRAMPIKSHELGITGICDVVELHADPKGIAIQNYPGTYQPVPVEYKRGKPKIGEEDVLQLVAQAMCLEEMLACDIEKAYLFYDEIKRRIEVTITHELREEVRFVVKQMNHYYARKHTPKVKMGKHCKSCSLENICVPVLNQSTPVQQYIRGFIE